jgi:hypothetical protein
MVVTPLRSHTVWGSSRGIVQWVAFKAVGQAAGAFVAVRRRGFSPRFVAAAGRDAAWRGEAGLARRGVAQVGSQV